MSIVEGGPAGGQRVGYQRQFDPEIADESVRAGLNDGAIQGAASYALAVTTASTAIEVPAGIYRVFLGGMDPAVTIALATGDSGVSASLPTSGTAVACAVFPGSAVERVRVLPGATWVAAISAGGSGTLYLAPLVPL